jgi:hypothetical protein
MIRKFLCFIGMHRWIDVKTQISKNICYGFDLGEPGYRVIQKCSNNKCKKRRFIKLNLFTPDSDLYNDNIWRDR